MSSRPTSTIADFLIGPPGVQRQRIAFALVGWCVYAVFALMQHGEVLLGMIDLDQSNLFSASYLSGGFLIYLYLRSGLNLRHRDPTLTLPQTLYAMFNVAWSYAITGPGRGAILIIMVLVIVFGMFGLRPRQSMVLGAFGFVLVAAVMVWKGLTDPTRYDPRVEAVHLFFAAFVVLAVSGLAVRLGRLRARMQAQKKELEAALERIQVLATRDELTGLLNRRAMLELLDNEAGRVQRGGGRMSLVLIDLDHFKRINDTHGHKAGDRVLRGFADLTVAELRGADVLARWGGEEFMMLLPDTPPELALKCVERVHRRLAAAPFDDIAPGLVATFSAGLAECTGEADLEQAIERADLAMYRAKTGGRDRTELAETPPSGLRLVAAA